jgi:hypothetical protein
LHQYLILFKGTVESDDDFSWEDDEAEDGSSAADQKEKTPTAEVSKGKAEALTPELAGKSSATPTSPQAQTPANTSPRESEDSYDLVSSGNVSGSGEGKGDAKQTTSGNTSDDDSDWE